MNERLMTITIQKMNKKSMCKETKNLVLEWKMGDQIDGKIGRFKGEIGRKNGKKTVTDQMIQKIHVQGNHICEKIDVL